MDHECKCGIYESLRDELRLKETKLFLNYMILYKVKVDDGAKPNIYIALLLLSTSEAAVYFLTSTSSSTTTYFLFLICPFDKENKKEWYKNST